MTFRSYIDGSDYIHVVDSQVWFIHRNFELPGKWGGDKSTYINGVAWDPVWTGKAYSNKYSSLNPPLPGAGISEVTITKISGRGTIKLTQFPAAGNGYEAIVLTDDDIFGGADWYEFKLNWKFQPSLPITLLSFSVVAAKNAIVAQWETTNEINNKGFELQRSEHQTNKFYTIGWVKGKGDTQLNNYKFIDNKVEYNKDYFYRIKQVDMDGKSSFSKVCRAKLTGENIGKIFPNPAKNEIFIRVPSSFTEHTYLIKIIDAGGTLVYLNEESVNSSNTIKIVVSKFPVGNYSLVLYKGGKSIFTKRFQIVR